MKARGVEPPRAPRVREFIAAEGFAKSNDGLEAYMAQHPDPELDTAWAWTTGVNRTVEEMVSGVPPFPWVRESLDFLAGQADMMVVSATPVEALQREWTEHEHRPLRASDSRSGDGQESPPSGARSQRQVCAREDLDDR